MGSRRLRRLGRADRYVGAYARVALIVALAASAWAQTEGAAPSVALQDVARQDGTREVRASQGIAVQAGVTPPEAAPTGVARRIAQARASGMLGESAAALLKESTASPEWIGKLASDDIDAIWTLVEEACFSATSVESAAAAVDLGCKVADARGSQDERAYVRGEQAGLLFRYGRSAEASAVIEQALADLPEARIERPRLLYSLGVGAGLDARIDAALDAYRRAEGELVAGDEGHEALRRQLKIERGLLWNTLGVFDLALLEFQSCLASVPADGSDPRSRVQAEIGIASTRHSAQAFSLVLAMLDADLEQRARETAPELVSNVIVLRALAIAEQQREGRIDTARAVEALAAATVSPEITPENAFTLDLVTAELRLRTGDVAGARERLVRIRGRKRSAERSESGLATKVARANLPRVEAEVAIASGDLPAVRTARDELQQAFVELRESWSRIAPRPGGIGFLQFGSTRSFLSTLERCDRVLDPDGRDLAAGSVLAEIVAVQELGSLARSLGARSTFAEARRRICEASTGILLYLPALDRSYAWAIDRDGVSSVELPSRDALIEAIGPFARALESSPGTLGSDAERSRRRLELESAAAALAGVLVPKELRERLDRWDHVVVVGAEMLENVAFEALRPGESWLGLDKEISYLPSLPLGAWLAGRDDATHSHELDFALVAAPRPSATVRSKFGGMVELSTDGLGDLAAPFASTLTSSGDAATGSAAADLARRCAVFAVWAHGVYDLGSAPDGERPAALALSPATEEDDDGLLHCTEVEGWRSAPVVELLTCGSMRGPSRFGDDTGGHLASAFFAAGSVCTITSRNDLVEEATREYAVEVNEALAGGDSVARSMLRARRALAASERWSDPHYWALLHAHGLANAAPFEGRSARADRPRALLAGLTILIAVGALGAAVVSRRSRSRLRSQK